MVDISNNQLTISSGFVCDDWHYLYCTSSASSGAVLSGIYFGERCTPIQTAITVQDSLITTVANALRVQLVIAVSTRSSGETSIGSVAVSTGASGLASPGGAGSSSGGLSNGIKAAIRVVVPLVVIGAAVLFLFLLRHRRNMKKKRHDQAVQPGLPTPPVKPELEASPGTAFVGTGGYTYQTL